MTAPDTPDRRILKAWGYRLAAGSLLDRQSLFWNPNRLQAAAEAVTETLAESPDLLDRLRAEHGSLDIDTACLTCGNTELAELKWVSRGDALCRDQAQCNQRQAAKEAA